MEDMAVTTAPPARREIYEDEHEDYRGSFRRFLAAEVVPHYERWEADGIVPRSLFTQMAEHGFLGMAIDERFGGAGVDDFRFNAVVSEEAYYANVGPAVMGPALHTDIVLPYMLEAADAQQQERWLPGMASGELIGAIAMTEPGIGSDLASMATTARRDGDDWIVNGAKTFITNGINADLVVTAVKTDPSAGRKGVSLLVLERGMEGFERGRKIEKVGQHAQDTAELFFTDVRVPAANVLGEEGSGFRQLITKLVQERLNVAIQGLAAGWAALNLTLPYVTERRAFGRPVGSFQNSRFVLAECKTELEVTQAFLDRCLQRHVEGRLTVEEAAMAKYWCTDLQSKVADRCLQLFGGYGYTLEYPISKAWADARVTKIYAGTNEIMKELIGRSMGLGDPPVAR